MRPVNLIPPDERRGDSAPLRTGNLIYVLVAGLALLVLGIVALALTGKQISDRQDHKASLEQELSQEAVRASTLAAFTNFRTVQESRAATVTSLADSRFDWNRVLHELSLVLPSDVSLSCLTGTAAPDVEIESTCSTGAAGGTDLRPGIAGPALDITGCAPSQDSVAGFVASLEDIDGVTRVGLDTSGGSDSQSGASGAASSSSDRQSSGCSAGRTSFDFHIVVAFDKVPTPPTATAAPSVPSAVAPATGGDQSQVADAQTQNQENVVKASVNEKSVKAKNAAKDLIPGG